MFSAQPPCWALMLGGNAVLLAVSFKAYPIEEDVMDEYGQTGPDIEGYQEDLRDVAALLAEGRTVYVKLAHRMTQYKVVLACLADLSRIGHAEFSLGVTNPAEWFHVSVIDKGANVLPIRVEPEMPYYVQEKLGLGTVVCGESVANFLAAVSAELLVAA
jgi:hypothetical protein